MNKQNNLEHVKYAKLKLFDSISGNNQSFHYRAAISIDTV